MGLDLYVGTLTRYCSGDWHTSVVAAAIAQGLPIKVGRTNPDGKLEMVDARDIPPPSPDEKATVRNEVDKWRSQVLESVRKRTSARGDLNWQESDDQPYFTDKPASYGFGALLLLAAYEDKKPLFGAKRSYPKTLDLDRWQKDPVLNEATRSGKSRYSHLFQAEAWLPGGADQPFLAPLPFGSKRIAFGSVDKLLAQLQELNNRTYRGSQHDLDEWRNEERVGDDDPTHPFEPNAKFGLAIFLDLAQKAVEHRLPMLLDY